MGYQRTPYDLFLLVSAVLSVGVASYVWRLREHEEGRTLFGLMAAVSLWTVAYMI